MNEIKTIKPQNKPVQFKGEIKFLSADNSLTTKVELLLLNDKKNRNNWIYKNLSEHSHLFARTPILISYKNGQLGAGHEMDEVRDIYGEKRQSFMSAAAERMVGVLGDETEIRLENIDGTEWIIGRGIIYNFYAPELVDRLKRTGTFMGVRKDGNISDGSMSISIETLIKEYYKEGDTEIYTKYQILGTTILGDNVSPAVENANIRALCALGVDGLREATQLRVASANEQMQKTNPQNKTKKGVTKMKFNLEDLRGKFDKHTVLGVQGCNVALLSETGRIDTYSFNEGEESVLPERINTNANCKIEVGEGDEVIALSAEQLLGTVMSKYNAEKQANESLAKENATLKGKIDEMQKAEVIRRKNEIKEAIKAHLAEIKADLADVEVDNCDDLLADEKLDEYAKLENGKEAACKEVDSRAMKAVLTAKKAMNTQKKVFAWDLGAGEGETQKSGIEAAIEKVAD